MLQSPTGSNCGAFRLSAWGDRLYFLLGPRFARHPHDTKVASENLRAAARLTATSDPSDLRRADFIVVAVPTPVDVAHIPDFAPLISASTTVAQHMKKGAIVVYESTVYPGATEEVCVPVLERHSGMRWKQHFHVGYSPERVNPGDKEHTFTRITKV